MRIHLNLVAIISGRAIKRALLYLFASYVFAPVYAAVATATVTAEITSTITVRTINGLVFGSLASGPSTGTLVLSPGGARSTTGGVTVNTAITGSPAAFDIQGDSAATYSITFPAAVILSNGSPNTMVVDNFTSSPTSTGMLDASGQQTLYVGGTLNVGSNQAFGTYSGSLEVIVDYN